MEDYSTLRSFVAGGQCSKWTTAELREWLIRVILQIRCVDLFNPWYFVIHLCHQCLLSHCCWAPGKPYCPWASYQYLGMTESYKPGSPEGNKLQNNSQVEDNSCLWWLSLPPCSIGWSSVCRETESSWVLSAVALMVHLSLLSFCQLSSPFSCDIPGWASHSSPKPYSI